MPQQVNRPVIMRVVVMCAMLLAVACSAGVPTPSAAIIVERYTDPSLGLTIPTGYRVEIVAQGLQAPTAIAVGPDGSYYLTQLGASASDIGQIVRVKTAGTTPEILLNYLAHPTGLTWIGQALYIAVTDGILVSQLTDNGQLGAPTPLYQPLPYHTHINGQISVGADGWLYFAGVGDDLDAQHTGVIYTAAPDGSAIKTFARGLHDAYVITSTSNRMYTTDVNEGFLLGFSQAADELNILHRGGDYGWPKCYAAQQENHLRGGDRNICSDTDVPLALLPAHSAPTGLALFDAQLIIALRDDDPPRLVSVDPARGTITEFITGFKRPIALTIAPDSSLLVVDAQAGLLYRITKIAA